MSLQFSLPAVETPRPKACDQIVLVAAVESKLEEIARWLNEPVSDDLRTQIIDAVRARGGFSDGYKLASYLERNYSWDPDEEIVEILGDLGYAIRSEHEKAVKQWVEANHIVLTLTVGTVVKVPSLQHVSPGPWTISKLIPEMATYGVQSPGMAPTSYYLVKMEDVSPAA